MDDYPHRDEDFLSLPPAPARPADRLALQGALLIFMGLVPGLGVAFVFAGVALCLLALFDRRHRAVRRRRLAGLSLAAAPFTLAGGLAILWLLSGYADWRGPQPGQQTIRRFASEQEDELKRLAEQAEHNHNDLQCIANLTNIGAALRLFDLENGRFPRALSELYPQYLPDLNVFVCPGSGDAVQSAEQIDTNGSYSYALPPQDADPATTRIVFDRSPDHHGGARYVLYGDGRVIRSGR